MPRKKATKRAAKPQKTMKSASSMQKIEKDFWGTPDKLMSGLNKDVSALTKKESKLRNAVTKIEGQVKKSDARIKTASKSITTSTAKKKLNGLKKSHAMMMKTQMGLNKQLEETTRSLETSKNQHAKITALSKHLSQFEKDWTKNSKKTPDSSKMDSTNKKSSPKANKMTNRNFERQPQDNLNETETDDLRIDETAEITS